MRRRVYEYVADSLLDALSEWRLAPIIRLFSDKPNCGDLRSCVINSIKMINEWKNKCVRISIYLYWNSKENQDGKIEPKKLIHPQKKVKYCLFSDVSGTCFLKSELFLALYTIQKSESYDPYMVPNHGGWFDVCQFFTTKTLCLDILILRFLVVGNRTVFDWLQRVRNSIFKWKKALTSFYADPFLLIPT